MKPFLALSLAALLLAGCGTPAAPTAREAAASAMQAHWGAVTFTAAWEAETYHSATAKNLPYPYMLVTGTPRLGHSVTASYVTLELGGKSVGDRYLFPGTDGQLYAPVAIDEASSKHIAYPTGTAYWRLGTYQGPLQQGRPVAFTLAPGARLERHSEFAGIRTDTWISLSVDQAPVVQSPPLAKAEALQ